MSKSTISRTVFVLDDNAEFRDSTQWLLESMGYAVETFANPKSTFDRFAEVDNSMQTALLLDVRMPGAKKWVKISPEQVKNENQRENMACFSSISNSLCSLGNAGQRSSSQNPNMIPLGPRTLG